MIYYKGKQYSKVSFIVGLRGLYYKFETFINDDKTSINDIFPSTMIPQHADLIYCVPNEEFIKFRDYPEDKKYYSMFFERGKIREVSLEQLIEIVETEYNIQVKIWNPEKWKALAIQA